MSQQFETKPRTLAEAPLLALTTDQWQTIVAELGLSKREARVAELILQDLSNREIATVMGISEKTVDSYLHDRIHKKTGTRGRMQLAMCVLSVALRVC
jgi:DNA-binding CsgD family transcriptional regulator